MLQRHSVSSKRVIEGAGHSVLQLVLLEHVIGVPAVGSVVKLQWRIGGPVQLAIPGLQLLLLAVGRAVEPGRDAAVGLERVPGGVLRVHVYSCHADDLAYRKDELLYHRPDLVSGVRTVVLADQSGYFQDYVETAGECLEDT